MAKLKNPLLLAGAAVAAYFLYENYAKASPKPSPAPVPGPAFPPSIPAPIVTPSPQGGGLPAPFLNDPNVGDPKQPGTFTVPGGFPGESPGGFTSDDFPGTSQTPPGNLNG